MRLTLALVVVSVSLAAAASCSSFEGGDAPLDADGGEGGGPVPPGVPPPSSDDAGGDGADGSASPCAPSGPPVKFASPGGTLGQITSNLSYVFWVNDGASIQRQAVGGNVVELVASPGSIGSLFATQDALGFQQAGLNTLANKVDAGPPSYVGAIYPPYAVSEAPNTNRAFGINGNYLYAIYTTPTGSGGLTDKAPGIVAIAANTTSVYYLSSDDGGVTRSLYRLDSQSLGGQTPSLVAAARSYTALAVDADNAYVHDGSGTVSVVSLADGTAKSIAMGEAQPGTISVREKKVYLATANGIRRFDLAMGCATTLSPALVSTFTIAGADVYYVAGGDVMKVPR